MPTRFRLTSALRWLVTVGLAGTALAVLVFGPRPSDQFPAGFTVVDYWEKWTGVEEQAMQQIVKDFNDSVGKEKHIFVRCLSTSAIEQKTLVSTAAGVPPDIAGLYNQDIPQFAALDALEPLDTMAAAHAITPASYKKVFWDECCYDGKLWGLVSTAYDIGLYYNTQIFQQRAESLKRAGCDPNRAPQTIEELDRYAAALDAPGAAGGLDSAGYVPFEPGWYLNYTCIWFGGSWWDERTRKFTFTDPNVVRAYQWVYSYPKRMGKKALADFRAGFGNFDSPFNAFMAGSVAMEQQGTFFANFVHTQKPSMDGQWTAAAFPSADPKLKDVTYCNCDVLVIPRSAKHKKEAFEFIAFVNRQDEMEKLARLHGKISPLSKVSEDFLTHHTNPAIRVFDQLAASPNAHPTEPVPILNEVQSEMDVFHQNLANQTVEPEEGLRRLQERLQAKYDDFMHEIELRKQLASNGKH